MAWEAILAMLPPVLIRLLIEKLVAVIVPAAGALLAIVEGLQAAWGTISSIIAAIDKFITFLKAVKGGGAGAQFAAALASAAIVVLDFVANFLIAKLASGLKKLAGKLGGIAKRLMKRRKAAGGRSARKARRNKQKRKGERGPKRKRRGASKPRRRPSRSRPRRGPGRPRGRNRGKPRRKPEDRRAREQREKQLRLDRAVAAIQPQVSRMLGKGVSKLVLNGRLLYWKLRYRLTRLSLQSDGAILAVVNPKKVVDVTNPAEIGRVLLPILIKVEQRFMAANRRNRLKGGTSDKELDTIEAIRDFRKGRDVQLPPEIAVFNRHNLAQYFKRGDSSYLKMDKAGRIPSRLLMLLERARGMGNVVAMDIADSMLGEDVPGATEFTGNRNVMSGLGAAKAADQTHFVEQGEAGQLTSSKNPKAVENARRKVEQGELSRMEKLGEVFLALNLPYRQETPVCSPNPEAPSPNSHKRSNHG
ncbi:MAG: hypothetical protein QM784_22835 [Polyangiaceae bacterium]